MSIKIDFNEVNNLIYSYMIENGLNYSAFTFKNETNLKNDNIIGKLSLINYLEKGLIYNKLETHLNNHNYNCIMELNKDHSCEEIKRVNNNFTETKNNFENSVNIVDFKFNYLQLSDNEKIAKVNSDKLIIDKDDSFIIKSYKNDSINMIINKDSELKNINIYNNLAIVIYGKKSLKILNINNNEWIENINFNENINDILIKDDYMLIYLQTHFSFYLYFDNKFYFKFNIKMNNVQFEFLDYPRLFLTDNINNEYFIFNFENGIKNKIEIDNKQNFYLKISKNKKIFSLYNNKEIYVYLDTSNHFLKISADTEIEDISFEYSNDVSCKDSNILIVFEKSNNIYFYSLITGQLISEFELKNIKNYYFKGLINKNFIFYDDCKIYIYQLSKYFNIKNHNPKEIHFKDLILIDENYLIYLYNNRLDRILLE